MKYATYNRRAIADTLLLQNAAISVQKLYESNEKAVADIFLSVIMKEVGSFSSAQEKTLQSIASQCPWVGGDAVYAARSLYRLIEPQSVFDDDVLCGRDSIPQPLAQEESLPQSLAELKAQSSETTPETLEVSLYPNPAKDGFTVSFNQALQEDLLLVLTDMYGRRKIIQALNAGTMSFYLNTADVPSGLYGCSIQSNRQVIAFNKVVITH
ncbi:MAG: T9SS type A sorting domain-containing protein [Saprospiraceae bacterium]